MLEILVLIGSICSAIAVGFGMQYWNKEDEKDLE